MQVIGSAYERALRQLTVMMQATAGRMGARIAHLKSRSQRTKPDAPRPEKPGVHIKVCDTTPEERDRNSYFDQGQFMARQDEWDDLAALLIGFDQQRGLTPGGMPVTALLAQGARADVVMPPADLPMSYAGNHFTLGLAALCDVLEEFSENYAVAMVVAQAHIDVGWSWRGSGWRHEVSSENDAHFRAHLARAEEIIGKFDAFTLNAPSLAATRCALLAGHENPADRVADEYGDLIDLDPGTPRHMRAMGNHLLPRWFGSYEQLDAVARETASRTEDVWGRGGYSWTFYDAIRIDPGALEIMDTDLFLDGVRDILGQREDQHLANSFAALCGLTMAPERELSDNGAVVTAKRHKLHGAFGRILRDHVREVHPLIWAEAAYPAFEAAPHLDRPSLAQAGAVQALEAINRHFHREIANGQEVTFRPGGVSIQSVI